MKTARFGNARVALAITATAAGAAFVLIAVEEIVHGLPVLAGAISVARVGAVALLVGSLIWQSEARITGNLRTLSRDIARHNISDREHDALYGAVMGHLLPIERGQREMTEEMRLMGEMLAKIAAAAWRPGDGGTGPAGNVLPFRPSDS